MMRYVRYFALFIMVGSVVSSDAIRRRRPKAKKGIHKGFVLRSTSFANGGSIPRMYTCDGKDVSPPLRWDILNDPKNVPEGTKSLAIICVDLDARGGEWTHWLVFNLPATVSYLPMNANIEYYKGIEGTNSWGSQDWGGPCPPLRQHRYAFDIYALSVDKLRLDKKAKRRDVLRGIRGHVLAKARLIGTYKRPEKR